MGDLHFGFSEKKLLPFLILLVLGISKNAHGQCGSFFEGDTIMAECGDSITLTVDRESILSIIEDDFNDQSIDPEFDMYSGSSPDFSEPCSPTPDSSPYLWMGPQVSAPRRLSTIDHDATHAERICFDFKTGDQASTSPCNGPDQQSEGIQLGYSIDGGNNWTTIFLFNPDSTADFTYWKEYCFDIPPGAKTNSTRFRWYQGSLSSPYHDHWGLDDVRVLKDSNNLVYDWGNGITARKDSTFLPSDTSSYAVSAIDTVTQDTCTAIAQVGYDPLKASIDPSDPIKCGNDSIKLSANGAGGSCDYILTMEDSAGDGWNGAYLTAYVDGDPISSHSANGSGSSDTISLFGLDTLSLEYLSGSSDSENSYMLISPAGDTLFQESPAPQTGFVYTEAFECSASGSYMYSWSPGTALSDPSGVIPKSGTDSPITYSLSVQDSNHAFCSAMDTVHVDTTVLTPNIVSESSFCANESHTLSLSDSYVSVLWNDSIPGDSLSVDSSYGIPVQQHWVKVIDSNGCSGTDTVQLAVDMINASITVENDTLIADNSGNSYQWVSCDSSYTSIPGATSTSFYPSSNGSYALILSDGNCTDTSTCKSSLPNSVWNNVGSGFPNVINGIHFVDSAKGWAVTASGQILHFSPDNANSTIQLDTTVTLHSIEFGNDSTGWVVGANGTVLFTEDAGSHWIPQNPGLNADLLSVDAIGGSQAWTVGKNGASVHTATGGSSWNVQNNGTSTDLASVFFLDQDSGWSVGANGTVLRTFDGGSNWASQMSGTSEGLNGVHFVNDSVGWAVGNNGTILVSSNAGTSWIDQTSGTNEDLEAVHFVNDSVGWIVGVNGTVLHTTDGRTGWSSQANEEFHALRDVHFSSSDHGWAGGGGGTLLRMMQGVDDPSSIEEKAQGAQVRVYPNPVKGRLWIEHQGMKGELSISLFNSLGQELKRKRISRASNGTSVMKVRDLEAGIYILRLEHKGKQVLRKLVVD